MLIRHGHTAANDGGLHLPLLGWTDVPLSRLGRIQVEQLCRRLRRRMPFAAIYASPLARAVDTARPLEESGLGPLRLDPALREINCGNVDGLPIGDLQRRFSELWRDNCLQTREDFRWPGGESYREFRDRCVGAIRRIAATHPGAQVAIVTHAGVISQLIGSLCGLSAAAWEPFRPGNASISELDWRGSRGSIVLFDCRAHLDQAA